MHTKNQVLVCAFVYRRPDSGDPARFPCKATVETIRLMGGIPINGTAELVPAARVDVNGCLTAPGEKQRQAATPGR